MAVDLTDGLVIFLITQSFYVIRKVRGIEKNNEHLKTKCPLFESRKASDLEEDKKQ